MLRLLHFSDIHFNQKKGINDRNIELRDSIINDLKMFSKEQSPNVNYILVCGDVAFSGNKTEYSKATKWLNDVCKIVKCKESNVLVVPGNHDTNRNVIEKSKHQALLHSHIKGLNADEADDFFGDLYENKDLDLLKRPFENFCEFANQYGCVPKDDDLSWELLHEDFGNYIICFRGCNSALLADQGDDDLPNRMLVSRLQRYINKQEGLIYILLCHHPVDCLIDKDETRRVFNKKVELQLYGHNHKFHIEPETNSLIIHAGAVHPDNNEDDYNPCYNIIDLDIKNEKGIDFLQVKVWIREWNGEVFKSGIETQELFKNYIVPIKNHNGNWSQMAEDIVEKNKEKIGKEMELIDVRVQDKKEEYTERDVRFKFLTLPFAKRKKIGEAMIPGSFDGNNRGEVQRSIDFLFEIKNKNQYSELWNELKKY